MKTVELTDQEYRMLQSALSFLDQDEEICENLECGEREWEQLQDKFEVRPK